MVLRTKASLKKFLLDWDLMANLEVIGAYTIGDLMDDDEYGFFS
jgi:hypothetical protein